MTDLLPLAVPPIVEVVADLAVAEGHELTLEEAERVTTSLKDLYPTVGPIKGDQGAPTGFIAYDAVETRAVQVGPWGLVFNDLVEQQPGAYTRWDDLQPAVLEAWNCFTAVVGPRPLRRIGLRYINRLRYAPEAVAGVALLRHTYPMASMVGRPDSFVLRMAGETMTAGVRATLVHLLNPRTDDGHVEVVVDHDVYTLPANEGDVDLPAVFAALRTVKNTLFLDSLTPEALTRYLR